MTAPPRCAPFKESQTLQGPHLLRTPDGRELLVNWSQEWWSTPLVTTPENAYAQGWRYIGLPLTAAQATALVRARDAISARLQEALKANGVLRARVAELEAGGLKA